MKKYKAGDILVCVSSSRDDKFIIGKSYKILPSKIYRDSYHFHTDKCEQGWVKDFIENPNDFKLATTWKERLNLARNNTT